MSQRLGLVMLTLLAVAACGGGGGGGGDDSPEAAARLCPKQLASLQDGLIDLAGGSGGSSGGDGGSGDGAGSLGQFQNTEVIMRDADLVEIGRTRTDEAGKVTIKIPATCKGPFEVEYKGGNGATYFDEASGRQEPFPEGKQLRVRFPALPTRFGVTPYTEAAVRLMESGADGITKATKKAMDPEAINSANRRISEVLTDQVAGTFRGKEDSFGLIDITSQPVLVNESNFKTPGTLTDTPEGRYGAILAGFVRGSNTFAGGGAGDGTGNGVPAASSPALRATDQLIEDLSDGQLDLQGSKGPVLAGAETPAYTYETFWRAKTIAAGLASQDAGDITLRQSAEKSLLGEYRFSLLETYKTASCREPDCPPYEVRSGGSETVRLYGDGLLTVDRGVSAAFGPNGNTYVARPPSASSFRREPTEGEVAVLDPATGVNVKFVDVKVGTRGQTLALQQDRKAVVHVRPIQPYVVTGNEESNQSFEYYQALLAPSLQVSKQQILLTGNDNLRVVSFTASPAREDRTYPGSRVPDFIYVLTDGTLWGVSLSDPTNPFSMPQPEPLQSVVYDQFVTPGFDPAYGRAPAGALQVPWTGPRRLFGLTRAGGVRTWLEGEAAPGVLLAIPGKVVLLAAESKTGVFALTGDGKVFWINADQAHVPGAGPPPLGRKPRLQDYARRFPLNHVQQVSGLDAPICWLARTEAIACKTGVAYRWKEETALLEYEEPDPSGGPLPIRQSTFLPVGSAIKAAPEAGVPPFWRISAVDEFYRASSLGKSINVSGLRYLKADGTSTTLEEVRNLRNVVTDLRFFERRGSVPAGNYQFLEGKQLRKAFETLFNARTPINITRSSTNPPGGFTLRQIIQPASDNQFLFRLVVNESLDPKQPTAEFRAEFLPSQAGVDSFRVTQMQFGDPNTSGSSGVQGPSGVPVNKRLTFKDTDVFRADATWEFWDVFYLNPVNGQAGSNVARMRLIPGLVSGREYDFRLCFAIDGQTQPLAGVNAGFRFSRKSCTLHANDGTFLGRMTGQAAYREFIQGAPVGTPTNIDFGQIYETE